MLGQTLSYNAQVYYTKHMELPTQQEEVFNEIQLRSKTYDLTTIIHLAGITESSSARIYLSCLFCYNNLQSISLALFLQQVMLQAIAVKFPFAKLEVFLLRTSTRNTFN